MPHSHSAITQARGSDDIKYTYPIHQLKQAHGKVTLVSKIMYGIYQKYKNNEGKWTNKI